MDLTDFRVASKFGCQMIAAVLIITSVGLCIGRIGLWGDGTGFISGVKTII